MKKLLFLIKFNNQRFLPFLLLLIIIMAILDVATIASIMPFIAVLLDPDLINSNLLLNKIFEKTNLIGVENNQHFILLLGILLLVFLILTLILRSFTTYMILYFANSCEYKLSKLLVKLYLSQSYSWYLNQNSVVIGKNILSEVQHIISGGVKPLLDFFNKITLSIIIIAFLVYVNLNIAILVGTFLSFIYLILFFILRKYLIKIGKKRVKNNEARFTIVNEAFNAVKEIKLGRLENIFLNFFSDPAKNYAKVSTSSQALSQMPRYFLEGIIFCGVILLSLFLTLEKESFSNSLPILALYAFAALRLMPALQGAYASYSQIIYSGPAVDKLVNDIENLPIIKHSQKDDYLALNLKKQIKLKNVSYQYPNTTRLALDNISLSIMAKSSVGIIGATGCGKTTTVDIILGLLSPTKGLLEVDGKIISNQNLKNWQKSLGYVPQNIYLADDTIMSNIAYGLGHKNNVDQEALIKAAKIANLHEFVTNELPQQYQTIIGERGVRLSGGQRQRIGIARALYNNPQIIIFDEATNALDNQTEADVMDALNNIRKDITIIIIAHRLNTLKNCDIIYKLDKGKVVNQGNYDQLMNNTNFDN